MASHARAVPVQQFPGLSVSVFFRTHCTCQVNTHTLSYQCRSTMELDVRYEKTMEAVIHSVHLVRSR